MDAYVTNGEPDSATGQTVRFNKFAATSILLALFAAAAMILDSIPIFAVFSVGAGHVALQQIKARNEQGEAVAYVALGLSYAIGLYALVVSMPVLFHTISQIFTSAPA